METSRRWWWRWLAEPSTPEPPPSSRSLTTGSQVVFCSAEAGAPPLTLHARGCFGFFFSFCGRRKNVLAEEDQRTELADPFQSEELNQGDGLLLDDKKGRVRERLLLGRGGCVFVH